MCKGCFIPLGHVFGTFSSKTVFVGKIKIVCNAKSSDVDHSDTVIKGGRTSERLTRVSEQSLLRPGSQGSST